MGNSENFENDALFVDRLDVLDSLSRLGDCCDGLGILRCRNAVLRLKQAMRAMPDRYWVPATGAVGAPFRLWMSCVVGW